MASSATYEAELSLGTTGIITAIEHPLYKKWAPSWRRFAHIYDGAGGFLDGTYLVAHPREWVDYTADIPSKPTKKLKARRKLARYENVGASIIDQKRAALFRQEAIRQIGDGKSDAEQNHPFIQWCENVDGAGTCMDDFMKQAWTLAAVFGYVLLYMDRPASAEAPRSLADQKAPYLRLYTPLDMPDWLTDDRGSLTAVKFVEPIPRTSLDTADTGTQTLERYVDGEAWWTKTGSETTPKAPHGFGRLPVVALYVAQKGLQQIVGESVLRDPQLFIDLYNLTSEVRELLRNQTFGVLNVPVGTGDNATNVETIRTWNKSKKGTEDVLFTPAAASYIQPDAGNVTVYQEERQYLLRTIYRLCVTSYEQDSKDAKSADALKLETESTQQVLASYADYLEEAEEGIADLWFRATYGADGAEQQKEAANLTIHYPDNFEPDTVDTLLTRIKTAIGLDLGQTATAELKKRLVPQLLPNLPSDLEAKATKELEQQPSPEEQRQMDLKAKVSNFARGTAA